MSTLRINAKVLEPVPVKGFSNYLLYEDGSVWSSERMRKSKSDSLVKVKGKWLKQRLNVNGYNIVHLRQGGKSKHPRVARLVGTHFLPDFKKENQVNHIDENRSNDWIGNLNEMTAQQNTAYSQALDYIVTFPNGEVKPVSNLSKFARENNLSKGGLQNVVNGNRKHHKQFKITKLNA